MNTHFIFNVENYGSGEEFSLPVGVESKDSVMAAILEHLSEADISPANAVTLFLRLRRDGKVTDEKIAEFQSNRSVGFRKGTEDVVLAFHILEESGESIFRVVTNNPNVTKSTLSKVSEETPAKDLKGLLAPEISVFYFKINKKEGETLGTIL